MDIVSGVVPVPCSTPAWYRQHAHLLVVANGFCRDAGGVRELADSQGSFHNRSSLCEVSGKKGTRSTGWKVKGLNRHTEKILVVSLDSVDGSKCSFDAHLAHCRVQHAVPQ